MVSTDVQFSGKDVGGRYIELPMKAVWMASGTGHWLGSRRANPVCLWRRPTNAPVVTRTCSLIFGPSFMPRYNLIVRNPIIVFRNRLLMRKSPTAARKGTSVSNPSAPESENLVVRRELRKQAIDTFKTAGRT